MDRLMWDWMRNKKEVALHREKIAKSGFMHKESPYTTQMQRNPSCGIDMRKDEGLKKYVSQMQEEDMITINPTVCEENMQANERYEQ